MTVKPVILVRYGNPKPAKVEAEYLLNATSLASMNHSNYKDLDVKRGHHYHYYYARASSGKPTLMFLHGFPSTSYDWHRQIEHFQAMGYGILAPDLLGAGGTSKPLDAREFRLNLMAADIVEILDTENLHKVVGIAHDWGCSLLSRLSMLYSDRFYGFGWIGLSFMEPITTEFDLEATMKLIKQILGYEGYSYWQFFRRDDAPEIIERNVDSFLQLLYPKDPACWNPYLVLPGKTAEWIETNMQPGRADYLTEEEYNTLRRELLEGDVRSSLNWYKSQLQNNDLEDNKNISEERWKIQKPSFFAAALKDCVCTPVRGKATMEKFGTEVTYTEFEAGHWLQLECSEGVNVELERWILTLPLN